MPSPEGIGHAAVGKDGVYLEPGWIYHGGVLKSSSGGAATVDVYDGIDTGGELIDSFACAASSVDRHGPHRGLQIRRRLYVDLGSNVSAFTVYYSAP